MTKFTEREIKGAWKKGYALDIQTISSTLVGYTPSGHPQFDTKHTEVGELFYQLKDWHEKSAVDPIAKAAATLLSQWKPRPELVVPVPPSTRRASQPVLLIAQAIAKIGNKTYAECVTTTRDPAKALKNVIDPEERKALLAGLYPVDPAITKGKKILLIDDLYRSGATMNAVTEVLLAKGKAASVVVLAITCTRSNA